MIMPNYAATVLTALLSDWRDRAERLSVLALVCKADDDDDDDGDEGTDCDDKNPFLSQRRNTFESNFTVTFSHVNTPRFN